MLASMRERTRSEGGFTLIELLVVMIIIAILMAVAVPTFLSQKNNAQKTQATANIKQIVNAIESCASNNLDGSYRPAVVTPGTTDCLLWTGAANTITPGLKTMEKGLVPLAAGVPSTTAPRVYQVAPIGSQGYMVQTGIQDGDVTIFFAEIHYQDGGLKKVCGGAPIPVPAAGATTPAGILPGAAVPQSRTCTSGVWG
jgi:prepilin-type N-terminal cleavage/methylation domain-containing protein